MGELVVLLSITGQILAILVVICATMLTFHVILTIIGYAATEMAKYFIAKFRGK